jgi:hypothetical protein
MKEMMRPTLKQIFHSEQVVQKECYNVMSYRREIEYTIGVLKIHLERIQGWQRGREQFNSEFVRLMQVIDAVKERAGDSKMVTDSGNTVVKKQRRPTLERIFNAEQVGKGACWNVMTYRREIESIIGVLESHLDRVKGWQRGGNREHFNSEFVLLMQELEASE